MLEDTSAIVSDPLSSALTKMKLHGLLSVVLDAGGHWTVDFPRYPGLTLNVVQKGEGLFWHDATHKTRLRAGDCFLLTGGREFTLASHDVPGERWRAEDLFARGKTGMAICNGGGDFLVAGMIFRFEGHLSDLMWGRLPAVLHIAGDSDQAAILRWSLDRFSAELRGRAMGRSLFLNHLAPIMLLQALRIYQMGAKNDDNWLIALSDPRLAKVFEAMQSNFEHDWSIEDLAALAGMSRSGFALIFKKKVGIAPMDFLLRWRMQIACDLLQGGDDSLSAIASAVGYGSESAFSVAFSKVLQCRPGAYRHREKIKQRV